MKKSFALVLGLALLAMAVLPIGFASRDVYHAMMYQKTRAKRISLDEKRPTRPYRPFSERTGSWKQIVVGHAKSRRNNPGQNPTQNLRYPLYGKRDFYSTGNSDSYTSFGSDRHSTARISPWQSRTNRTAFVMNKNQGGAVRYKSVEAEDVLFEVPTTWEEEQVPFMLKSFSDSVRELSLTVEYVPFACSNPTFTTCAMALSKDRNYENPAERIYPMTRVERMEGFENTIIASHLQTAVFTESFQAVTRGKELFIARQFVADDKGGVYILEARAPKTRGSELIATAKRIFDSFHIKNIQ